MKLSYTRSGTQHSAAIVFLHGMAMGTPIGNLELCGEGRQVVAPPSIHPTTGQLYRVE